MAVSTLKAPSFPTGGGNPLTGVFGKGKIKLFYKNGTFTAPYNGFYRVRLWGAGGVGETYNSKSYGGCGGGFALKEIYLSKGDEIAVTVGENAGATSSFGAHVSATGGRSSRYSSNVGRGVGGDINFDGGLGNSGSSNPSGVTCGSAGSLIGDGVNSFTEGSDDKFNGRDLIVFSSITSIDQIGTSRGASMLKDAGTGGGGNGSKAGGFPAGGGWQNGHGAGLVVVEY